MEEARVFELADRTLNEVVAAISDEQWDLTLPAEFQRRGADQPPTLREVVEYHAYDDAWCRTCWSVARWTKSVARPSRAICSAMRRRSGSPPSSRPHAAPPVPRPSRAEPDRPLLVRGLPRPALLLAGQPLQRVAGLRHRPVHRLPVGDARRARRGHLGRDPGER